MFETGEVLEWCRSRGWCGIETLEEVPDVMVVDLLQQMSGRDAVLLGWLARLPLVTQQLVGERFGLDAASMSRSVRRWVERGWVEVVEAPIGFGKVGRGMYRLGPVGADLVGAERLSGSASLGMAQHSLVVGNVAARCERDGWSCWTEREMGDVDGAGAALVDVDPVRVSTGVDQMSMVVDLGIEMSAPDNDAVAVDDEWWNLVLPPDPGTGRVRRHRPDLVVSRDGRVIAIEVELTRKSVARIHRILDGYQTSRFDQVVYVTGGGATPKRLVTLNTSKTSTAHCDRLAAHPYTSFDPTQL